MLSWASREKDSEMEEVCAKVLLVSALGRTSVRAGQEGQREEPTSWAVSTEASADPKGPPTRAAS